MKDRQSLRMLGLEGGARDADGRLLLETLLGPGLDSIGPDTAAALVALEKPAARESRRTFPSRQGSPPDPPSLDALRRGDQEAPSR